MRGGTARHAPQPALPATHVAPRPAARPAGTRGHARRADVASKAQATLQSAVDEYNQQMQQQMGWAERDPYKYHPERGLYFHEVWPDVLCGSQPRSAADVDRLAEFLGERGSILNLQQDRDLAYWGVDLGELQARAEQRGIRYVRTPARDFDADSLRSVLPSAVAALHREREAGRRVYVHCTAGLGRAPAVCIAYLYWFQPGFQLATAYSHLTDIRPCGPRGRAIRAATYDLLDGRGWDAFEGLPGFSYSELNETDKHNLRAALLSRF